MDGHKILDGARRIYDADDPALEFEELGIVFENRYGPVPQFVLAMLTRSDFALEFARSLENDNYPGPLRHFSLWTLPAPMPFEAVFLRQGIVQDLTKMFVDEPQVGDPAFDDKVYISTNDTKACLATLTDRCQGSILNCLKGVQSYIVIKDDLIGVVRGDQQLERSELEVLVAHFAQWVLPDES